MSNITLYVGTWAKTTAAALKRRGDRGQGAVEYVGIIILVGVIIAAVVGSGAGAAIANGLVTQITNIVGGG
ncbi:hypothetical protein [Streptomyces sp. CB03238]|uniref:hypothetical protein n=1 Tax=Streptomyces sp. CB03238 TaxID=1907777 RepID=UPI000A120C55|nr:hypothetical protein [Streptomyces sp. CB03238]ORT61113.1 hypothetical protein BKD26_03290 [Streptomyces sp. CB03238]